MKKTVTFIFTFIVFLTSCYTVKYTHDEVMDNATRGTTKAEILRIWGIPTYKQAEGNYEF